MMRHVMLDIETTGVKPGCNVVSIGMCEVWKPENSFYAVLADQGGVNDPSTIEWWGKQKGKPSYDTFDEYKHNSQICNPVSLHGAVKFLDTPDTILWCKGADFDYSILGHTLRQYGLKFPVKYNRFLCLRTTLILTGDYKKSFGASHNALDDAKEQSKHLIKALQPKTWQRIDAMLK